MTISRRRVFQSLALASTAGTATDAAESALSLDLLRNVSAAHGTNLSDARLQILKPVLERRQTQIQPLRDYSFDDATEPTQGILDN